QWFFHRDHRLRVHASLIPRPGAGRDAAHRRRGLGDRDAAGHNVDTGDPPGPDPARHRPGKPQHLPRRDLAGGVVRQPHQGCGVRAKGGDSPMSVLFSTARARRFARSTEMSLLTIGVLGFLVLAAGSHGGLLHGNAIRGVLTYLTVPILIGLAQLVVLAAGQMNLSVGALGGFLAVFTAGLMADHGVPAPLAIGVAVLAGALIGAVNGVLVVATRINGFIVTLATMTILLGLQYRVAGTRTIDAG